MREPDNGEDGLYYNTNDVDVLIDQLQKRTAKAERKAKKHMQIDMGNREVIDMQKQALSDAQSEIEALAAHVGRLRDALQELAYGGTEQAYRTAMKNAPCHNGITDIDGCARCGREIKAIRALAPLLTESKTNGDQDHG